MSAENTISFSPETFSLFRLFYEAAVKQGEEEFVFEDRAVLTSYAKYMIEYVENNVQNLVEEPLFTEEFVRVETIDKTPEEMQEMADVFRVPVDNILQALDEDNDVYKLYRNNEYQVAVYDIDDPDSHLIHLSIKRLDKSAIHDWRKLQDIKNKLVGPEHEAVEIYPAESRLVDTANQYHLWVFKDPEFTLPFGFNDGRTVNNDSVAGGRQRPSEDY